MTMAMTAIPQEVTDLLEDFCQRKRSGSITLDIKDGNILVIRSTTSLAVSRPVIDKRKRIT